MLGSIVPPYTLPDNVLDETNFSTTTDVRYYTKTEIDSIQSSLIAMFGNYYTKTEVDTSFGNYYAKTEVDTFLGGYYTKTQVDASFGGYYTKTQVDSALNNYYTKAELSTVAKTDVANTFLQRQTVSGADDSAQLKLERTGSSAGVGYIGANSYNLLHVYDSSFNQKFRVTQAGQVLASGQPAFYARNPPVNYAGPGYLTWSSIDLNRGGCFATDGTFTASVEGVYEFYAHLFLGVVTSSSSYGFFVFHKNGLSVSNTYHSTYNYSRSYENLTGGIIIQLAVGDTLKVYFTGANGGTTYASGGYSCFMGKLLL